MSNIVKSENEVRIRGTLLEKNLVLKEGETKDICNFSDRKKDLKNYVCDVIENVDFKHPSFLIECSPTDEDGKVLGTFQFPVDLSGTGFGITSESFNKDGVLEDNNNFENAKTIINEYVTKKDAIMQTAENKRIAQSKVTNPDYVVEEGVDYEVVLPTRIEIKKGSLKANEYYSTKTNKFTSQIPKIEANYVTSTNIEGNDVCEADISGIIRSVTPEIIREEETGRLKIDFYTFSYNVEAFPIQLMVEEKDADSVLNNYQAKTSCKFFCDIVMKQIGSSKPQVESAFNGRQPKQVGGFSICEFVLYNATNPYTEENELYISVEDMKDAIEKREIKIANITKKAKDKKDNGGSKANPKGASANKKDLFGSGSNVAKEEKVTPSKAPF